MKTTRTSKYIYNKFSKFPKCNKEPKKGEVWLALFPYETLGNMEKLRPVYIVDYDDNVKCRMITTNPKYARKIKGKLTSKYYNKDSYIKDDIVEIPIYKLYGRLRNKVEIE